MDGKIPFLQGVVGLSFWRSNSSLLWLKNGGLSFISHVLIDLTLTGDYFSSMAIVGDSNYADKIMAHMCCGFPLSFRGSLPRRCVCPPSVRLQQGGFDCKKGNEIDCNKYFRGGDVTKPLDDPFNMYSANFSLKTTAFIQASKTCLKTNTYSRCYQQQTAPDDVNNMLADFIKSAVSEACTPYEWGSVERKPFCMQNSIA